MALRVFLSGRPGSGKSTVLRKVIDRLRSKGLKVGGIITPEIRRGRKRLGFKVVDVYSGEEGILAHVGQKTGPRVSKYRVNLASFEKVALSALDFALERGNLCIIDELGKMEFFSDRFKQKVHKIIESDKPLIATVHRNYVNKFKRYGKMIRVTRKNRDQLPRRICNLLK